VVLGDPVPAIAGGLSTSSEIDGVVEGLSRCRAARYGTRSRTESGMVFVVIS
jgi:hypothetical protein